MMHSLLVSANADTIAFLRSRYLGDTWTVTDDPDVAIKALENEVYDRIFLDHWLKREPRNGRDVTLYLGAHPQCNPTVTVIAMTTDQDKATEMIHECKRKAYHIPIALIVALGT